MKMIILSVSILCLFLSSNVFAVLSGGGTQENPYLIQSRADFDEYANPANASIYWTNGVHTKMMCNLDFAGTTYTQAAIAPDINNSYGNYSFDGTQFSGVFDGNGFIISNLTINKPYKDFIGLFGYIGISGKIRNLGLVDFNVINGDDYIGGLAGINSGSITNCYATGKVSGTSTDCYYIGGLVGANNLHGSITNCYATGEVSGTGTYSGCIGGLVGYNVGSITNSYAVGPVKGTSYIGGLCGFNNSGTITNSFWDTETSGLNWSAGGTGKTTAEMKDINTFLSAGWDFAGESGNGLNDYWQMLPNDYPRFAVHTWTLAGEGSDDNPYIIANAEDLGKVWLRPSDCYRLDCNLDLKGIFWTTAIVAQFSGVFDGQNFVISNLTINQPKGENISLFGVVDKPGQVKNLGLLDVNLTGSDDVGGLVGYNYGSITDCYVTGAVKGNSYVGGIVGDNNDGSIAFCYAAGAVSGNSYVAGLIGYNNDGSITNCYTIAEVNGTSYIGGLVGTNFKGLISSCYAKDAVNGTNIIGGMAGYNTGSMTNSYAAGAVSGNSYVGGLVGSNSGSITNSYAVGPVKGTSYTGGLSGYGYGTITDSFWDKETSSQTISAGGTGKTTAEMKDINTFLSAGWDFVGETSNGTDDIWRMIINVYPIQSWIEEPFTLNTTELTITEGQAGTFQIVLPYQPTEEVRIRLVVSGNNDFEILTASPLIFNAANWNIPQVVNVKKNLDDNYFNDRATLVLQSKDYRLELPLREIDIQPVLTYEVIKVSSKEVIVPEGKEASFTVKLAENPLQPVEIHLTISGDPNISIRSDTVLFFDSNNYAVPQKVTVRTRWEAEKKDTQAELLLSSPDLQEQLSKTITITKKDIPKAYRLSKPPAWLDGLGVMHGANALHLSGNFNNPSDASWYAFRVASVPRVPAVPGHYGWIEWGGPIQIWGWIPGKRAIPAKNRARFTFTSDHLQTASIWVAVYQQVDSRYKCVKSKLMLLKPGKSSSFKFVKKADVNYYVAITPAVSDLGSYSLIVTKAAIH
jgi:hypothetical protein